jgi:YD repeat-containing protein
MISINVNAQDPNFKFGLQTPTAASLGKFGDIPVSFYTGTPNISIPLFELKSRILSLPITLDYHASGLKIEEIAGWVGLGWALNAGGVITRTVRGIPDNDEPSSGYSETGDQVSYYKDHPGEISDYIHDVDYAESADPEPDIFFFNFAGYSGKFVYNDSDPSKIYTIPYKNFLIEWEEDYWLITTEDGTKYYFEAVESGLDMSISEQITQCSFNDASSWYLSKIESAIGNDKIQFYYTNPTKITRNYHGMEEVIKMGSDQNHSVTEKKTEIDQIWLDSIVSANFTVHFNSSERADEEYKLDSIEVKKNGNLIKKYKFSYIGAGDRIMLDELSEISSLATEKPPYKFTYYTMTLPARDSFAMDHWGFYNGQTSNTTLIPYLPNLYENGANREPYSTYMKAGILTKIEYPTGGYTEFTFEPHDYLPDENLTTKQCSSAVEAYYGQDFQMMDTDFFRIDNLKSGSEITLHVTFTNPCTTFTCSTYVEIREYESPYTLVDQYDVGYHDITSDLDEGKWYKLIAYTDNENSTASAELTWEENLGDGDPDPKVIGGLRIQKIKTHDGMSTENDQVITYDYTEDQVSSGVLYREPLYTYFGISGEGPYTAITSSTLLPLGSGRHIGYKRVKKVLNDGSYRLYYFNTPTTMGGYSLPISFTYFDGSDAYFGLLQKTETYDGEGEKVEEIVNQYTTTLMDDSWAMQYRINKIWGYVMGEWGVIDRDTLTSYYRVYTKWLRPIEETVTKFFNQENDSLVTTKTYEYESEPFVHLQPVEIEEDNSDGTKRITKLTYAHEIDEYTELASDSVHMFFQRAQETVYENSTDSSNARSSIVTTYSDDQGNSKWVPHRSYIWSENDPAYSLPSFNGWSSGSNDEWQLIEKINKRDINGNILEYEDAHIPPTPTSIKWGYNSSVKTAEIINATDSETFVDDFGQDLSNWTKYNPDDSDTEWIIEGSQLKQMNYSSASSGECDRIYYDNDSEILGTVVLEFDCIIANSNNWDLTIAMGGSSWVTGNGGSENAIWTSINNEIWKYYSGGWSTIKSGLVVGEKYHFKIEANCVTNTADFYVDGEKVVTNANFRVASSGIQKIAFGNYGYCSVNTTWYIDNVRLYPADALCASQSYDPNTLNITGVVDESGNSLYYNYDSFNRLQSVENNKHEVMYEYDYYFSRQGNFDEYDSSDPNYISMKSYFLDFFKDDFSDASQSASNWEPNVGSWAIVNEELRQSLNGNDCFYVSKSPYDNYSDFEMSFRQKSSDDDRIGATFRYQDNNNHYRFQMNKQSPYWGLYKVVGGSLTSLASNSNSYNKNQWYNIKIICMGENIKIYVDANLVFDVQDSQWSSGKVGFYSDWNRYSYFDDFSIQDLKMTFALNYFDGLGRDIQTRSNWGSGSIVTGNIYDDIGRLFKVTKPFFSDGQDFVIDPTSSANTYYSQIYPYYPEQISDVGNYAYYETGYSNAPLNRVIKSGAPGTSFHINSGNEIIYDYSTNTTSEVNPYQENTLFKLETKDENGNYSWEYKDKFENTVLTKQLVTEPDQYLMTQFEYNILDNLVSVKSPNYFNLPTGSVETDWITSYEYNSLSQVTQENSPDAGTVEYIYDKNGNTRFKKDENGQNEGHFIYYKYDSFSRIIEEGIYNSLSAFSQNNANNADFPQTGHTSYVKYTYDESDLLADSPQNFLAGKLAQIEYDVPDISINAYILYSYNDFGEIEWIENHIPKDSYLYHKSKNNYEYDRYGKILKLYYRQINPVNDDFYVWYDYDEMGRMSFVSSNNINVKPVVPDAKYTYWPSGKVKRLELAGVQGLDYSYNSRDWLTQINHEDLDSSTDPGADGDGSGSTVTDRFAEIIGYNAQRNIASDSDYLADFQSQYTGNISWLITNTFGNNDPSPLTGWIFNYDKTSRLLEANWGYYNADWISSNMYDISDISYDDNGNLDYMQRNNRDLSSTILDYRYKAGTNKIDFISGLNGQAINNYTYDFNGNLIKDVVKIGASNTMEYDYRNQPTLIPTPSGSISFGYDHSGQRVKKNDYIYIRGINGKVIAAYDTNGSHLYWNVWGMDLISQKF